MVYDARTQLLFSGDMLYPGRLYVPRDKFGEFRASADRLAAFAATHPISRAARGTYRDDRHARAGLSDEGSDASLGASAPAPALGDRGTPARGCKDGFGADGRSARRFHRLPASATTPS
ncbi:hypothetical protein [Sphingomonas sp. 7/4-4]|uniref:hypothetical protein n=1 Tax=Sphingomonas sp. 7/4-4 TaxID=3018446 RepID=UPI003FA69194